MILSCASLANSLGLILDIAGVLLLWKYGLPESIDRTGEVHLVTEEVDQEEKLKAAKYDVLAKVALSLVIAGFLLQLASNFIRP